MNLFHDFFMKEKKLKCRILELFLLLFLFPSFLLFIDFESKEKIALSVFIFLLILGGLVFLFLTWKKENSFNFSIQAFKKDFVSYGKNWYYLFFRFLIGMLLTGVVMYFYRGDEIFSTILNHPDKWLLISFVYLFISVYPQEFIYRCFFVYRYKMLFKKQIKILFLVNATLFSLAHLFFRSPLILLLTFIGGLFFMHTYRQSKSIHIVSVEHALYGSWLFALGIGRDLGFPF